jgi:hypothetical protein
MQSQVFGQVFSKAFSQIFAVICESAWHLSIPSA